MTFRSILLSAAFAALPVTAFAHPGHIAAQGDGHSHLLGYAALACAVAGIALWARARLAGRAKASPQ
ncbi:MAG: hypothetical protein OEM91_15380 [Hyphomicrobiales bacterium]|nr:hypothetical protein [Hyphomicrobiales bacterium]